MHLSGPAHETEQGFSVDGRTMWDATIGLLGTWHARPAGHSAAKLADDDSWLEWAELAGEVEDHFTARGDGRLADSDRAWIEEQLTSSALTRWDAAHALAWGIDAAGWPTFTEAWLGADVERVVEVGALYPVCDVDSSVTGPDLVSRPGSLGVEIDELAHVRRHRNAGGLRVVFDRRFEVGLAGVLTSLRCLVTMHPNETLDELNHPTGPLVYGVGPADEGRQRRWLTSAMDLALGQGNIVVLPELCVTEALVDDVQGLLDGFTGECLVVAGSYHGTEDDQRRNIACGLLPDEDERLMHRKLVAMEGKRTKEGITVGSELRIWVADRWRLAIGICKDAIVPAHTELLARLGVNVLAVPAMTPKIDAFEATVMELATRSQAFVAVANNPSVFGAVPVTSAVFGQPLRDRTLYSFPPSGTAAGPRRGVCQLRVGDDQATWIPWESP